MKIKVYTLNAFGKSETGGNPAGVVLDADNLTQATMLTIAKKVGFSETAFVMHSSVASFKVRFFTPKEEVDLCGHASIATFYVLLKLGKLESGKYTQETKAGVLDIEVSKNGTVLMNQALPEFMQCIDKEEIADSLKLARDCFIPDLPIQIVSTGLKDILIPVKDLGTLLQMKPDFQKITAISKKHEVVGYHVFSLETMHSATAHCRNFAPLYDIPEESATGTSNGALSCYLFKNGKIAEDARHSIVIEQGYSMNQPSEIRASIDAAGTDILAIKVGGNASGLKEMMLEL